MKRFLTRSSQTIGLAALALVTVVLCYLALTRTSEATPPSDDGSGGLTTGTPSSASPSSDASGSPSPDGGSSGGSQGGSQGKPGTPPTVKDQLSADFAQGDPLPAKARLYDNDASADGGMQLVGGALSVGDPQADQAISSMEAQLPGPVQKLSAKMSFAETDSGSVVLVAWQKSLVDARTADQPVPASGLRLVVSPGEWQLTVYDKQPIVIGSGTWSASKDGVAEFSLYRQDDKAWVVAPGSDGRMFSDPRIGQYAGPWACWQLAEDDATQKPAELLSVSAG